MAGDDGHAIPPRVEWAQRSDRIYLTICTEDCKKPTIKIEKDQLYFRGIGGAEQRPYEITLKFFKEIKPEEYKYALLSRHIPFILLKKDNGPYWPRLLKSSEKVHWLKTDFAKWRDEDDESGGEEKEKQDVNFEQMMQQMGNFSPPSGDVPEEGKDSDDEDLPDLI